MVATLAEGVVPWLGAIRWCHGGVLLPGAIVAQFEMKWYALLLPALKNRLRIF